MSAAISSDPWEPDHAVLKELAGYLRDALSAHNPAAQKQATLMLGQAKSKPETTRYLAYMFRNGPQTQSLNLPPSELIVLRSSAAINLKNIIKASYRNLDEDTRAYVRATVLPCLEDAIGPIRSLTGTVITEIVQRGGVLGWPELFSQLLSLAANDRGDITEAAQEGSMGALVKICDDRTDDLDREYQGQRPIQVILPRLLQICKSPVPSVRSRAVTCLNAFIPQKSDVLLASLDAVLDQLFHLAQDSDPDVRRNLCRAFNLVIDIKPDRIIPHMEGLVDYMNLQQKDPDERDVALEAAEFWLAVSENEQICPYLEPYLRKIVPLLLESMVYDEETIIRESARPEDAAVEDRTEDIKPRHATSKLSKTFVNASNSNGGGLEDGEIEDEDDEDDQEIDGQWNLRKCSAAALDVLASKFHQLVFDIALEHLSKNLANPEWPYREAAVLAMGAIAEGCMGAVAPALPNIVPYFISLLKDREPSVRQITCWALGRYSEWALNLNDQNERKRFLESMLHGILERMLDNVKKVQTAAASAFAIMGEKANKELIPYLGPIINTFVACFDVYKTRNMYVLYDCVQTLADQVGSSLRNPELTNTLMPAIINRWKQVPDEAPELFPLNECLSYVVAALGPAFAPFAVPIFARCISIIRQNLEQHHLANGNANMEKPDKDFLVTTLDLISAIIQTLEPAQSGELVQKSEPRFFDLLLYCMEDRHNDVRQSSYALLGDCAVNIFPQLHPNLPTLLPITVRQLDINFANSGNRDRAFSVINNACWACGEIAMRYRQEMAPYTENLYRSLKAIIDQPGVPVSVGENASVAIGRLGVHSPTVLAPHLGEFVERFLTLIEPVQQTDEKAHAFLGLNRIIRQNPYAMGPYLLPYIQASLAYSKETVGPGDQGEAIGGSFQQIPVILRNLLTPEPGELQAPMNPSLRPPGARSSLVSAYNWRLVVPVRLHSSYAQFRRTLTLMEPRTGLLE
ncbi:uncharacterized protein KY384_006529 [Bacidia gigantensis]|uniref:uncharacterized protein n=1 Tax=Bacidia gigantensis TaxID=2732470 RepID=UPI001D0592BD|nr:uncharacterized protein KY384_006529 [Bacidia gigantensis]KAG8528840.1 hypothetical protein KY384_006529 [Bacidia gigantensis]